MARICICIQRKGKHTEAERLEIKAIKATGEDFEEDEDKKKMAEEEMVE